MQQLHAWAFAPEKWKLVFHKTWKFTATLFVTAHSWKWLTCSSTCEQNVVHSDYLVTGTTLQSNLIKAWNPAQGQNCDQGKILVFPGQGSADHTSGANPAADPCMTCELRTASTFLSGWKKLFEENNLTWDMKIRWNSNFSIYRLIRRSFPQLSRHCMGGKACNQDFL